MIRSPYWWPIVIIASAVGAGLALLSNVGLPIRAGVTFMFLLICPGMAFVRLLHFEERVTEWVLAIALSLALNTFVAEAMVYAKIWSPEGGFFVLIGLSVIGALLQIFTSRQLDRMT